MNANEIIDEIEKIFPDAHCELNHDSTFQLLTAVILSAQTTDASVNRVTPALFAAYPTAEKLAEADQADVENYLKTLGLFRSKAKNIISMAKDLQERYQGIVPSSYKDLQSLAGVGRKTANVVRSVAFDIPALAVDTHVDRVSKRLGLARPEDSVRQVEEKLKRKLDRNRWNQAHHDLIFFGRYFCTAKKPKCEECPFTDICKKDRLDAWNKAQKDKKNMSEEKKNEQVYKQEDDQVSKADAVTANTLSEVEGFVETASVLENLEQSWNEQAEDIKEQARILVKAQDAVDEAAIGKPFKPSRETEKLFADIDSLVEAQNDIDNGFSKADPEVIRHIQEENEADEWNPETVIDEKIKEEQDETVSQDLRDEIVQGLEGE